MAARLRRMAADARVSYALAMAVGLVLAASLFPAAYVLASDPAGPILTGDPASHLIAMRYFLAAPWSWPPLLIPIVGGGASGGNLGLADGIPLASLATKLLHPVLPASFQPLFAWLALSYVLQPVAAVFAVRSAGERRLAPALAAAAIAASLPAWLAGSGHVALSSHFLILIALGLYARACAGRRWAWAAAALLVVSLLVHPYLLAMVAAVLAAAPLSLLARGDRLWLRAAAPVAAGLAVAALLAALLGYGDLQAPGGFGVYSMNLLSPVYPARSAFLPGFREMLDATGGQYEGVAYLGIGLGGLLAAALVLAARTGWRGWRRHAGLLAVCAALVVFALSNRVFAGSALVLEWPEPPEFVQQFRASGRFIWPVTYAAVIWAVVMVARRLPGRAGMAALAVAALAQVVDVGPYRRDVLRAFGPPVWLFDATRVRGMMAASRFVSIRPKFNCGAEILSDPVLAQLLDVASAVAVPLDTFFAARVAAAAACDEPAAALQPGELRFYVAGRPERAFALPNALRDCRVMAGVAVCSTDAALLAGLPPLWLDLPAFMAGKTVSAGPDLSASILPSGWAEAQPEGRWTLGGASAVLVRLDGPAGGRVRVRLDGFAMAPAPGGAQDVSATEGGRVIGQWHLQDMTAASLYLDLAGGEPLEFGLHVTQPVHPADRGFDGDTRPLGFFLRAITVEPADG